MTVTVQDAIERQLVIPVTRQRVWEAITAPGQIAKWFADSSTLTLEEGAPFVFQWMAMANAGVGSKPSIRPTGSPSLDSHRRNRPVDPLRRGSQHAGGVFAGRHAGGTRVTVTESGFGGAALRYPRADGPGQHRRVDHEDHRAARLPRGGSARAMIAPVAATSRDVSSVFLALADPTRRKMIEQLSVLGPVTISQLTDVFPISRQAVTKHLDTLYMRGWSKPSGADGTDRDPPSRAAARGYRLGFRGRSPLGPPPGCPGEFPGTRNRRREPTN